MKLAAIDIGSNAARMLIAESMSFDGNTDFTKLNLLRIPLRLGFDVFQTGRISSEKIAMIIDTMHAYNSLLKIYKVEHFRACATSAMRDAKNGMSVVNQIKEKTGIQIDIISGSEEANILFETHIAETLGQRGNYLYIDVGGGSTELTFFSNGTLFSKESFNLGTIRILTDTGDKKEWNRMNAYLRNAQKSMKNVKAIGSGGNINKLFSLSKIKEGKPLSLDLILKYKKQFESMTLQERMHYYNLREDRADVIIPALDIYSRVMKGAGASSIFVPKIGLADGLIRQLYYNEIRK